MAVRRRPNENRELAIREFFSELAVGRLYLTHYGDEVGLWMERILLWPAGGAGQEGIWAVRSPDGDVWPEDTTGRSPDDGPDRVILMAEKRRRPSSLGRRGGQMYCFSENWSTKDLRGFVEQGRASLLAAGYELGDPVKMAWLCDGSSVGLDEVWPAPGRAP